MIKNKNPIIFKLVLVSVRLRLSAFRVNIVVFMVGGPYTEFQY